MSRTIVVIILVIMVTAVAGAQGNPAPLRIEAKAGIPNIAGLSVEYVLPFGTHAAMAIAADISYIPGPGIDFTLGTARFSELNGFYWGCFIKYYFTAAGTGFYILTGFANLNGEYKAWNYETETIMHEIHTIYDIPVKGGYRWIAGSFTVQIEAGTGLRFFTKENSEGIYHVSSIEETMPHCLLYALSAALSIGIAL